METDRSAIRYSLNHKSRREEVRMESMNDSVFWPGAQGVSKDDRELPCRVSNRLIEAPLMESKFPKQETHVDCNFWVHRWMIGHAEIAERSDRVLPSLLCVITTDSLQTIDDCIPRCLS